MMHDLRAIGPETELIGDHRLQVLGGGVVGFSPMKVPLPEESEDEITKPPSKVRPYGYEGFFTLGAIFAHGHERPGNTRLSVGTYLSAGNQPHSHEVGQADAESFEPHPDDSAQAGLVGEVEFGRHSAFFAVPLAQLDTVVKLKSWRGIERRFLAWAGSKAQGMNVWNVPTVTAKTDGVYFRTNHTLLGLGATFYLGNEEWDLAWSLTYRRANDGDLILAEQTGSFRFFDDWRFRVMLYGGVKLQKAFEENHHEEEEHAPIEMKLGPMTAYGGSFNFHVPLRHARLETGVAAGSLHARKDRGLDPVSGLFEPMPRRHFLVRPYALGSLLLPRGELGLGLSWYGGLQNYVTDPGDAPVVKRSSSFEARLAWNAELVKRSHEIDLTLFVAYLRDSQRFYRPDGELFSRRDDLVVLGAQIFYGSTVPLRASRAKSAGTHPSVAQRHPSRPAARLDPHSTPSNPLRDSQTTPVSACRVKF